MRSLAALLLLALLTACGNSPPDEAESRLPAVEQGPAPAVTPPRVTPETWTAIADLESAIRRHPDSLELRETLVERALLPDHGLVAVVGVGRRTHPETGRAFPPPMVEKAARSDGARWAAYVALWRESPGSAAFGDPVRASVGATTMVEQREAGDSLYLHLLYPIPEATLADSSGLP